jgi:hypothetical protein
VLYVLNKRIVIFLYISSTFRLLSELNPEVSGDCVDESVEQVLNNRPDFLTNFDLVIATEISEKTLITFLKIGKKKEKSEISSKTVSTLFSLGH